MEVGQCWTYLWMPTACLSRLMNPSWLSSMYFKNSWGAVMALPLHSMKISLTSCQIFIRKFGINRYSLVGLGQFFALLLDDQTPQRTLPSSLTSSLQPRSVLWRRSFCTSCCLLQATCIAQLSSDIEVPTHVELQSELHGRTPGKLQSQA